MEGHGEETGNNLPNALRLNTEVILVLSDWPIVRQLKTIYEEHYTAR